jgi:polar amino acid transport system substrate-binding protein
MFSLCPQANYEVRVSAVTFDTNIMKKLQTILVVLFAAAGLLRAQTNEVIQPAPLKVGVTPIFPPMIFKEAGKICGVEADFAKEIGAALGRPIEFVEVGWEDQIPALIDGRTDIIMSDMSITTARQLRVSFANPYLQVGQIALIRREDAFRYSLGFPVPPPGTVGVVKATTGDFTVQQEFPRTKRKTYKTAEDGADALVSKRIDLFINDAPTIWWLAGVHEADGLVAVPALLTREQLAWGVRRSDLDLLNTANATLSRLQASGRSDQIIKHWIPLFK